MFYKVFVNYSYSRSTSSTNLFKISINRLISAKGDRPSIDNPSLNFLFPASKDFNHSVVCKKLCIEKLKFHHKRFESLKPIKRLINYSAKDTMIKKDIGIFYPDIFILIDVFRLLVLPYDFHTVALRI